MVHNFQSVTFKEICALVDNFRGAQFSFLLLPGLLGTAGCVNLLCLVQSTGIEYGYCCSVFYSY
jgi:hypothetical protein